MGGRAAACLRTAVLGASILLVGCAQPREPMPYAITSLAVLPADVTPHHEVSGRQTSEYVTAALAVQTSFRVVGVDSASRLLAAPPGQDTYMRFRDQARTAGEVAPAIAALLARRMNVQALVLPSLVVTMRGRIDGRVALSIAVYEPATGSRVWMNRREQVFRGTQGDPGFLRVVREMAEALVTTMPRPQGEEVWQ